MAKSEEYAAALAQVIDERGTWEQWAEHGVGDHVPNAEEKAEYLGLAAHLTLAADCVRVMQALAEGRLLAIKCDPKVPDHRMRYEVQRPTPDGFGFTFSSDPLTAALRALAPEVDAAERAR